MRFALRVVSLNIVCIAISQFLIIISHTIRFPKLYNFFDSFFYFTNSSAPSSAVLSLSLSSSKSVSLWHSHLFVPTHYNLFPSHSLNRAVRNTDVSCDFRVSMFYTRDIHKYVRKPKLLSDINSVATICFSLHREKPISKLPSTVEPRKIERIKLLVSIKRYCHSGTI